VRVTISENRCRLFIGNIPKDLPREDFMAQLTQQGGGITNVDFLKDPDNPARNRGFAFVEYQDHPSADRARRNLSRPQFRLGKNNVTVNWADPQPEADDELMSQVKVLYIRNLPSEPVSEDQIREIFASYGEIERVVVPPTAMGQKRRDFCFVHYVNKESAHEAANSKEKHEISGRVLEVTLAKPVDKRQRDENRLRKQTRALRRTGPTPNSLMPVPLPVPHQMAPNTGNDVFFNY
jgi:heterogeneous nuclear ribonucleoprotein R